MRTVSKIAFGTATVALVLLAYAQRPGEGTREDEERAVRNERLYHYHHFAKGRVIDQGGRPVANVRVFARFRMHQSGMVGEGGTTTDANGNYQIRALGFNDFMIGVEVRGTSYLVPDPQPADLRQQESVVRDFVLKVGPLVTVRVLDAETGAPVTGLDVHSSEYGMAGPLRGQTDAKGEVSWHLNAPKEPVMLGNRDETASREAVGAAPGYRFFHEFRLDDGQPVWTTKAYDKPFAPKTVTFHGIVVDEKGTPRAGARVRFQQDNGNRQAVADDQGRFAFPGRRIVDFAGNHLDDVVLLVDDGDLGATVRPTPEETWNEIRLVARPNHYAQATARVVDEKGHPASGVRIDFSEYFVGGTSRSGIPLKTDAEGRFRFPRLRPDAEYSFSLGGRGWGTAHLPFGWPHHELRFTPGERRDLGTVVLPHATGSIMGTLTRPDGDPETRPTLVTLHGAHTDKVVVPESGGRFRFVDVVDEPLTLRVFAATPRGGSTGDDSPDRLIERPVRSVETDLRLRVDWRTPKP